MSIEKTVCTCLYCRNKFYAQEIVDSYGEDVLKSMEEYDKLLCPACYKETI